MSGTAGGPRAESLRQAAVDTFAGDPVVPNFLIGLQTLIASAALPLLSAFTPGVADLPPGTKRVTCWITYTRGAAGGYPAFRASSRPVASGAYHRTPILDLSSFAAAAPNGAMNFYLEQLLGPIPADAAAITYELTFLIPANAVQFQLEVAELGVPATPGTVAVNWTGDG